MQASPTLELKRMVDGGPGTVALAFRLASAYPRKLPTVAALRAEWGMSRATAYRWLAAMRDARGLA